MASFNVTVEDSSPLFIYAPAGSWIDTPSNDPLASSYSGASYHATSSQDATATITFTGTGFSIFGGQRSNYGTFSVTLDGETPITGSAHATTAATRQVLATTSGLPYGSHTIVFTNTGGSPIDIDSVDFETSIGQPGSTVAQSSFDDTNPAIVYSPSPSAWQLSAEPAYFNSTLHFSQVSGASASMTFSGEAVALYGTVSPTHANMVVSIDGQAVNLQGGAGGFASSLHAKVLLYYRGDLDSTVNHTINLSRDSQALESAPFVDLDMIYVFAAAVPENASSTAFPSVSTTTPASSSASVAATGSTLTSSSSSGSSGGASRFRASTGLIIGAALGGILLILFLLATIGFLCFRRRRNRSAKIEKSMIAISPMLPMQNDLRTPVLPMQRDPENGMRTIENPAFPFPVLPQKAASLRRPVAPRYPANSPTHSRDASVLSNGSSTPLIPSVPTISIPQPRSNVARKPVPTNSGLDSNTVPARPSKRPPTFDFTQVPMGSPR